jgi:hypothetical protein
MVHANAESQGRRYHAYYGTEKNLMPTDEVITGFLRRCGIRAR